ncbi:MAG TPA: RDD family protein [Bryobacteraceae bacterium]
MTPQPQTNFCSECGRPATLDQLARFGDRLVCPYCKDAYAQKLREGVTPTGVVEYGGFWVRFLAFIIDAIILGIPVGIIQGVLFASMIPSMAQLSQNPNPSPDQVFALFGPMFGMIGVSTLISVGLGCTYESFFLVKYAATPGKMALGLKVLRPDGAKLEVGRAIGRYFAKMLSAIILYIGYIMAGFDAQKRALHDMLCDTRVIKSRG